MSRGGPNGESPAGGAQPAAGDGHLAGPAATGTVTRPDGTVLRYGTWPADPAVRPRGTVFILTGRSEFVEKYAETAGDLAGRGFATVAFDWRGQGLSTRDPPEDTTGHLDDFDPLVADAEAVWQAVVAAAPQPVVVLAHSMGGGLALRLLARRPGRAAAAILTAPMVDPIALPGLRRLARILAPAMVRRGRGRGHPPGEAWALDEAYLAGTNPHLTSDPRRGAVQRAWVRRNPALGVRGVTWGWLAAAFRSGEAVRAAAPAVTIPVLMVLAGRETLVDNRAAMRVAARMPDCTVLRYRESRHEILMEADAIRARFWRDVDAFLARCNI